MRNPDRIRPFLAKLEETWERYPDLRFGQLVTNLASEGEIDDIWYPEEDLWIKAMDTFDVRPGKFRGEK